MSAWARTWPVIRMCLQQPKPRSWRPAVAISPIDLVPGIIPVAGQMDDVAALLIAIRFAVRMTPKEVSMPHLERAGIMPQQIDDDLKAVRDATVWLAKRAARSVRHFAQSGAERISATMRRLAKRSPA